MCSCWLVPVGESHNGLTEQALLRRDGRALSCGSFTEADAAGCCSATEVFATSNINVRCKSNFMFMMLPCELIASIAAHLPLEGRVRLAATCTRFRAALYDTSTLWKVIRFSSESGPIVTDTMLCALLTRCSARTRTAKLSLMNCTRVTGWGLAPLYGSSFLRYIGLHTEPTHWCTHGPSGLDDDVVADILRPSVRGASTTTVVPRQEHCREDQLCARCNRLSCNRCTERFEPCFDCDRLICRDCFCRWCEADNCSNVSGHDCSSIFNCDSCYGMYCTDYENPMQCEECGRSLCSYCNNMSSCAVCGASASV